MNAFAQLSVALRPAIGGLRSSGALAVLVASSLVTGAARADEPTCASLPNPVYFTGTLTGSALLQKEGAYRAAAQVQPVTYVFVAANPDGATLRDSCDAVKAVIAQDTLCHNAANCLYGTAEYYTFNSTHPGTVVAQECTLPSSGIPPDVALSDVFATTCDPTVDASSVIDFLGPVRPLVFVAPIDGLLCMPEMQTCESTGSATGSPATLQCCAGTPAPDGGIPACVGSNCTSGAQPDGLSAEDAYFLVGFSSGGAVGPWAGGPLFLPGALAGDELVLAAFLGVPSARMYGSDPANGGDFGVLQSMTNSAVAGNGAALGLVSTDFYDQNRNALAALAYRTFGQNYAYYPDVNSYPNRSGVVNGNLDTREKQNVRDGHYPLWGYLHAIAPSNGGLQATNPHVEEFGQFLQPNMPLGALRAAATAFSRGPSIRTWSRSAR
jgi:hypothetical protein